MAIAVDSKREREGPERRKAKAAKLRKLPKMPKRRRKEGAVKRKKEHEAEANAMKKPKLVSIALVSLSPHADWGLHSSE